MSENEKVPEEIVKSSESRRRLRFIKDLTGDQSGFRKKPKLDETHEVESNEQNNQNIQNKEANEGASEQILESDESNRGVEDELDSNRSVGSKISVHASELNEQSNILANYIRSKGIKEETLIPLFIERSNFMITGMLGIMKAGCAYVPIDIDFPAERMSFMLKDTEAEIVVSSGKSKQKLPCTEGIEVIELDSLKNQHTDNLQTQVLAGHLAYVIYTSGSTGNPKGVMVEQGNLADYVTGLANKICINECNSFALVSTIATDLGNTVIYGSLATGGTLHILSKELVGHIERLHQYFEEQNIDCLKIVPSHWRVLSLEGKLLLPQKLLVFGGEALQEKIVEDIRLSGRSCQIINHYGPTETTIGKLLHIVEPGSKYEHTVPIGKPFSNTKVLVLDKNLKLCPVGVPGQLYITGEGVARGYLNNTILTNDHKRNFIWQTNILCLNREFFQNTVKINESKIKCNQSEYN